MFGNVEPLGFVFQYFADSASLDSIAHGNIFLSLEWMVPLIDANGFSIHVEESLLALLLPGGNGGKSSDLGKRKRRERLRSRRGMG